MLNWDDYNESENTQKTQFVKKHHVQIYMNVGPWVPQHL